MQLVFQPPDRNTPGFLRRAKTALEFQEAFQSGNASPSLLDKLVDFLLDFVAEPEDRGEAANILWDASEAQFMEMLESVSGTSSGGEPTEARNNEPASGHEAVRAPHRWIRSSWTPPPSGVSPPGGWRRSVRSGGGGGT